MGWELIAPSGQAFPLRDGAILGRSSQCDVAVPDAKASRQHVQFWLRGNQVMVQDLNSTNGTYVNRVRITAATALRPGDQIAVGDTVCVLRWTPDAAAGPRYSPPAAGGASYQPPAGAAGYPGAAGARPDAPVPGGVSPSYSPPGAPLYQPPAPAYPYGPPAGPAERQWPPAGPVAGYPPAPGYKPAPVAAERYEPSPDAGYRPSPAPDRRPRREEAANGRPTCPNCGRADTVQTAAQAGLALPEKPSNDWLLAATIGFWAMAILAALITVVYIASGLVGGTWLELLLPGAGFGSVTVLTVLAGLAIYMPFLAVVIGVPWFIRRHLARKDAEEQAAWKRMQQAWGRLRYCTACIGVFLLDRRRLVPLGQVETLFV